MKKQAASKPVVSAARKWTGAMRSISAAANRKSKEETMVATGRDMPTERPSMLNVE